MGFDCAVWESGLFRRTAPCIGDFLGGCIRMYQHARLAYMRVLNRPSVQSHVFMDIAYWQGRRGNALKIRNLIIRN